MAVSSVDCMKDGLINNTYLILISSGEIYVLQCINTTVFSNISNLMQNILKITKYLQDKHKLEKISDNNCLVVIPTTDGKSWLDNSIDHEGVASVCSITFLTRLALKLLLMVVF